MGKGIKPISPINEAFAALVKSKGTQVETAALLGISSQSVGYYMRGRKIPAEVILKVQSVYGVNLLTGKTKDVSETNVSRETKGETKSMPMDVWQLLQKDNDIFQLEFNRLWGLIDRLVPQAPLNKNKEKKTNGEP